jgi:hypothetical protein
MVRVYGRGAEVPWTGPQASRLDQAGPNLQLLLVGTDVGDQG